MTKPQGVGPYVKVTQRGWPEWVALIDGFGGRELAHPDIVPLVQDAIAHLDLKNHGWWAQGITIAYEQHIGRRIPGQQGDGTFAASASKSVSGSMDAAITAWIALVAGRTSFNGLDVTDEPTTSATAKWRYWRCQLEDDSRVNVTVNETASGKCRVAVQHSQLVSPEAAAECKTYWKTQLAAL
ncbi:hypothetical protein E3O25_12400 [Cryobacterium sp. TMT1-3]|uniref:Uncharacterized protein n=1 Tax=Cryobacterium luteum TaxID=1424661 RepID=A0A1H8DT75_9MICO|nr:MULTISPECIES: hypothetical protein [Cryobacterium]TFB89708.1 hypothetical protein E3O10_07840 [Cryobacterium luteum]TFC25420.1 hypothetical protein E3O25_12400 [Cryobacterium sp. TMT1-3]SEN10064.1 hypothetical protein SAMN05216281_1049 [Cryobacterium luteum]